MQRYLTLQDLIDANSENRRSVLIKNIKKILKILKKRKFTLRCPKWTCTTCKKMFPQIKIYTAWDDTIRPTICPCYAYKNKNYLIKRLEEIIKNWPSKKDKKD